jgi:hypothetical protein
MTLPKEWQQEAERITKEENYQSHYVNELTNNQKLVFDYALNEGFINGATAYKQAVEKETTVNESELEQFADNYVAQYLPHVDTTGHWIGFQDGYKKAMADMKFKLTTLTPTSNGE